LSEITSLGLKAVQRDGVWHRELFNYEFALTPRYDSTKYPPPPPDPELAPDLQCLEEIYRHRIKERLPRVVSHRAAAPQRIRRIKKPLEISRFRVQQNQGFAKPHSV
jgi:hypothetical protein